MKVKSESEVAQSCPTLSDPMDCRLPGSSIHGICQARVLEWVAIAFPNIVYMCVCVCIIYHIQDGVILKDSFTFFFQYMCKFSHSVMSDSL